MNAPGQSSIQFPSFDNFHSAHLMHPGQYGASNPGNTATSPLSPGGNNPNSTSSSQFPPPLALQPSPQMMGYSHAHPHAQGLGHLAPSFGQVQGQVGGMTSPIASPGGMGHNSSNGNAGGVSGFRGDYGQMEPHLQYQQQQQQQLGKRDAGLVGSMNRLSMLPEESGDQAHLGHGHPQSHGHPQMQSHSQQPQHRGEGDFAGYHPSMQNQMQGGGGYAGFGFGRDGAGTPGNQNSNNGGNGLLSPNQGHLQPQGQGQQQQQAPLGSPLYQPAMQNGYRSPSVSSPNHQHVGPNAQAGNMGMDFPSSASAVTPEQAARYGIAGLGTPLGSGNTGIGAWMDGVNAAGVKSAGGNGNGWLESSPLQQQQQQQPQQGQQGQGQGQQPQGQGNARRNMTLGGDREGASSAALPSPNATGNPSGPFASNNRSNAQDVGNANWSGFPNTGSEQGRNQAQGQGQGQGQANNGQPVGQGQGKSQQRGSQSTQGQGGSRPSSSAQQRSQPQQQSQQQQEQQQSQDEVVDGNNAAGDANAERMIGKLVDDEVIPTAIVIKNIPFAVQKETLLAIIESLQAPLPYAFNYHHDNGVFRGLAFANFRHPHEADAVVVALNGYDISGRKLRVEYKKVLQAGEKERIEREKAIKRMRSMQFDRGQLPAGGNPPGSAPGGNNSNRNASGAYGGQNRQNSWSQSNNNQGSNNGGGQGNNTSGGNQQNGLHGIPANLLASMTPQQLQSLAASLPGGVQNLNLGGQQQGQSLTPPGTTQSQSSGSVGMVSHLSHVYIPQHVTGALIRERTESTNTTGSQTIQRDNKSGQDSAFGSGSMQAMQQQHLQQLQNPDRLPSPALSLGGASHHGSSNGGHGGLSPSLNANGGFSQNQPPMPGNPSNASSQTGYNDVDFNDPVVLDIFSRALMFKEDRMRDEFSFSRNLSVKDRRAVHAVGEKLGLHHYSTGDGQDRYVVLSKVDPSRNNPSRVSVDRPMRVAVTRNAHDRTTSNQVLSRQSGRVQSMAAQSGSYLSTYSPPVESTESRPESPGLRIKKSMPNMSLLNGPTVSRDPHRLLNKRSSGNLRDYANVGGNQQSRRPFASHTGATGSSSFNNLFGNALGNGTFEQPASSPTSPTDPTLATQGASLPGLPGGFVRQPLGPTSENKGFVSRTQLRSQSSTPSNSSNNVNAGNGSNQNSATATSGGNSKSNGVIGGQRVAGKGGDSQSIHTSGSSTIEEEEVEVKANRSD